MATQMFKGEDSEWVHTQHVQNYLEAGWSFDDPNGIPAINPETIYPERLRHIDTLSPDEQRDLILQEMGIIVKNPEPVAIETVTINGTDVGKTNVIPIEKKKRGRPKKVN